jgi:hypothetical protein
VSTYSAYNIVLAAMLVPLATALLRSRVHFIACVRAALTMVVVAFPWGVFARLTRVWEYTDPGATLYGVPLNDLWFMGTCTFFASALLTWRRPVDAGR